MELGCTSTWEEALSISMGLLPSVYVHAGLQTSFTKTGIGLAKLTAFCYTVHAFATHLHMQMLHMQLQQNGPHFATHALATHLHMQMLHMHLLLHMQQNGIYPAGGKITYLNSPHGQYGIPSSFPWREVNDVSGAVKSCYYAHTCICDTFAHANVQ